MKNFYATLTLALSFLVLGNVNAQTVHYWEQFDGDANGWVSEVVSPLDSSFWNWFDNKWQWSATGAVNTGAFFNVANPPAIASETVGNGAMVFNADFYTTQGVNTNVPPGPPYVPYHCHLISPSIDLTAATAPVQLVFNQYLRFLNVTSGAPSGTRAYVSWSTNGGGTWSTPQNVAPLQAVNAYGPNDAVISIPMTGVQGSADLRLRFSFSSDFYFWAIDDIKVIERPAHDMRVNGNFYAVAPNLQWPLSMAEHFSFLADIQNLGSQAQTGVNLNITIEDADETVLYTQDLAYGTIDVDSIAENEPFAGDGFLPTALGVHTGTYTVSADSTDFNPADNTQTFAFLMTDTLFAKENGVTLTTRPATASWGDGEPWSWAYGNYFYVPTAGNYFFSNLTFSMTAPADLVGEIVTLRIYEWEDSNADEQVDPTERTPVATMLYDVQGTETSANLITIPIQTLLGSDVPLKDNTHYIAAVEFQTDLVGATISLGMSRATDYGAMVFRSRLAEKLRYGSVLGVLGNLADESYSSLGFGYDFVPVVRVTLKEVNNTKELLNPAETVKIYPNPANDLVRFDVKLKETSSLISVQLLDLTGRIIETQQFQNLKEVFTSFNTSRLANGTYLVRIDTDLGYTTELFVVQK
jgi:hypothetical protein